MKDIGKKGGEIVMSKKDWGKPIVKNLDVLMTEMSYDAWFKAWTEFLGSFKPGHPSDPQIKAWIAGNSFS